MTTATATALQGKTCVMTGATSGIGLAAAVELAARGARLVLVARNPARADDALAAIRARTPAAEVEIVRGDLARLAEPKATVVVPGKVLAAGEIHAPLTVAAFHFSTAARAKILSAGGSAISIHDLLKIRPDGSGVHLYA